MTRQWVDQAKKSGQQPGSGAPDGTFAAGVTRVTELLPVLMNDIIATAPEDQKVCLSCLSHYLAGKVRQPCSLSARQVCTLCQTMFYHRLQTGLDVNSRAFSLLGQNQETLRDLGAIKHISCFTACFHQREVGRAQRYISVAPSSLGLTHSDCGVVSTTPEGSPAPGFVPLGHAAATNNMAAKPCSPGTRHLGHSRSPQEHGKAKYCSTISRSSACAC